MRIVFDLDDTISAHRNRDYENAAPITATIEKMRDLKKDGCEIVIYTSRGQVSCKGDLALIEERNREQILRWLKKHDVPCDELIFGKPIADLYVDDKAMSVEQFQRETFGFLHGGGSNKPIYRIGNMVKKTLGSASDTADFREWVEDNNGSCKFPRVISYLYDAVYMEFIEGTSLVECFTSEDLQEIIKTLDGFSTMKKPSFDIGPQIEVLLKNRSDDFEINEMINMCAQFIERNKDVLNDHASYSHGDAILSNIIKGRDGELYFIDPRYFKESSSFLLDFGKLRNSLSGYELNFGISDTDNTKHLADLDSYLKTRGIYDIVVGLHLMYVLRLYRYKDEAGKRKVKNIAKGIIEAHGELFERY